MPHPQQAQESDNWVGSPGFRRKSHYLWVVYPTLSSAPVPKGGPEKEREAARLAVSSGFIPRWGRTQLRSKEPAWERPEMKEGPLAQPLSPPPATPPPADCPLGRGKNIPFPSSSVPEWSRCHCLHPADQGALCPAGQTGVGAAKVKAESPIPSLLWDRTPHLHLPPIPEAASGALYPP